MMNSKATSILIVVALVGVGLAMFSCSKKDQRGMDSSSGGIQWHSYNDGVALARTQNKKLLIDVYTDWCGWCKKMDSDVYTNENIRTLLASNFVAVKLNAESSNNVTVGTDQLDEASLARAMGVSGYPTTVFLDSGAGPITKVAGYMEAKEFATVLRFIGEDHYKNKTFDQFKSSVGAGTKN
ncbi:MAG: thioredoxin family protein [Ignavibacteriales bacterium]|nr:thioredoxin family protein [Ignavibacteriales bacterium]